MREGRVLVTGGAGYIGSAFVRQLLERGYRVRVVDSLRSGGESLLDIFQHPSFEFENADIRDESALERIVAGCDAVVHLAAIVGDPACRQEPELAKGVNLEAPKALYRIAESAGCQRFVFSSTCSNYGRMEDRDAMMTEESRLAPISLYAETKVAFEEFLIGQPRTNACKPTCLRFSTAYGLSPRMRFDLTVNEFTKELALGRELLVYGEKFWRPYCHVVDLSRALLMAIEGAEEKVAFETFNVGDKTENYTKAMILQELERVYPAMQVEYKTVDEDPRDYRVSADKIHEQLGFEVTRRVPDGISEIATAIALGLISDPNDPRYSNI